MIWIVSIMLNDGWTEIPLLVTKSKELVDELLLCERYEQFKLVASAVPMVVKKKL